MPLTVLYINRANSLTNQDTFSSPASSFVVVLLFPSMGIPFRGYLDSRDSVLEERVKEEGPRLNQRHGFRDGERQGQRHLDEQQRNLRSLQAGMEMYRRSIAEEEADRYAGAVGGHGVLQEPGFLPDNMGQEPLSEHDSLIETIIHVHRRRMGEGEVQGEMDEERIRRECHRLAERIRHTYLRNVDRRVGSLSRARRSDECTFAFRAIQVMVGHLDRFDMNPRLNNNQYSPMRSYSVESMANRLMDIWRREMHTSSEQILERFHRAIEEGNLTAVFQTAAIMRSPLGMVGPTGDTALHLACLHGHYEIAQFLLDMGHAANVVDEDGATPLHDAAAGGYLSILGLLLDKAPDCVHRSDNDGDSPLHNAVRGDHFDCVSMLLDAGADPYCTNSMSLRPIDLTTHGSRTYTRLFEAARDAPLRHAVIDPDS